MVPSVNTGNATTVAPAARLRKMISGKSIVVAPGVFIPVLAKLAGKMGFQALYFSGGGFSASLALPDLGVTTLDEVSEGVARIAAVVDLPIIVDVDTGFGEALNVARTVKKMESIGAAAIHIEDQVMPKRCGHLPGKELVDADEMVKKVISALEARRMDLVVIARTDARAVGGLDLAIERARLYVKAGADMAFADALESPEEFEEFAKKVNAPLLANMTEFGKTPMISAPAFEKMGYKIVIFPVTAFRMMMKTAEQGFAELKEKGTQQRLVPDMMSRSEFYDLIDYYTYEKMDQQTVKLARELRQRSSGNKPGAKRK